MTAPTHAAPVFTCSICEEPSQRICNWCTKDACENHICGTCLRCSDCCVCDALRARQREGN
jgi:hypothetical protein